MWSELTELVDEVRRTHNTLTEVIDDLHADTAVSARLRAVLEYVDRHGPAAVPDIARARRVSRQHIQTTVNELLDRSLVAYEPNPQHRRSHLVVLTPSGAGMIATLQAHERQALEPLVQGLDPDAIAMATATLRSLRLSMPDPNIRPDPEEAP
jgi:DNA-binding MarR family transcriptional regulator